MGSHVPLHFALIIHAHQPVGNFDHVIEQAYRDSYLPFIETLARFPRVHLTLHYSGCLLEWLAAHHPEFFRRVRALVRRGQVEVWGGGFYEPILTVIPEEDRQAQLRLLGDFVARHFGRRPRGMWLAERVWEPTLPTTLRTAGIEHTLTDDQHFLAAGLEPEELYGYYVTEHLGAAIAVIPGSQALRYLIPFHSVRETLDWLRGVAARHPGGLVAMGDDCEKFGVWPGTHELCYRQGWLGEFFSALEASRDSLRTVTASDYLDAHPPRGLVYLPTASYREMTKWALPAAVALRFERLLRAAEERGDADQLQFLRGGFWRNFFAKYREANFLHKRMLAASARVRRVRPDRIGAAYRFVLRGQCNDAYWHGIFGGLYAPHLRTAVSGSLLEAERRIEGRRAQVGRARRGVEWEAWDYDLDGEEELVGRDAGFLVWFDRNDGATLEEIDLLGRATPLVNSLRRRPEAYHEKLRELDRSAQHDPTGRVGTIHERVAAKETGLAAALVYDPYNRHAFRLLVFPPEKQLSDLARWTLEEDPDIAGGDYQLAARSGRALQAVHATAALEARKDFGFRALRGGGIEITCGIRLRNLSDQPRRLALGVELIVNLLAPDAPDRYFVFGRDRQRLAWGGEVGRLEEVRLVDEYRRVEVILAAARPERWWIVPLESVSQSEAGFERVYQGSSIVPVWRVELEAGASWERHIGLRARPLA